MLKQRVITALVLLAILIPALAAVSPWPFAVLTLLFIGAAGWAGIRARVMHSRWVQAWIAPAKPLPPA